MNPFEILGIHPPRLSISALDLERDYHCLSLLCHPDHHASDEALAKTSALNAAYRALRDPWSRADAFLKWVPGATLAPQKSHDISSLANAYFEIQESEDLQGLRDFAFEVETRLNRLESERESLFQSIDSQLSQGLSGEKNRGLLAASLKDLIDFKRSLDSMLRDLRMRLAGQG